MRDLNALNVAHDYIKQRVKEGGLCIDATAGRGRDTVFLSQLVGDRGKVLAFDIQQQALDSTAALLAQESLSNVALILDSHANMEQYAAQGSVDCITFNLGWLPGGDHGVFTKAASSIAAIEAGLRLLKVDGIMTICIYYGRDCGFEERDMLLEYLPTIDHKQYSVLTIQFTNRPNNPPIPVIICREN